MARKDEQRRHRQWCREHLAGHPSLPEVEKKPKEPKPQAPTSFKPRPKKKAKGKGGK